MRTRLDLEQTRPLPPEPRWTARGNSVEDEPTEPRMDTLDFTLTSVDDLAYLGGEKSVGGDRQSERKAISLASLGVQADLPPFGVFKIVPGSYVSIDYIPDWPAQHRVRVEETHPKAAQGLKTHFIDHTPGQPIHLLQGDAIFITTHGGELKVKLDSIKTNPPLDSPSDMHGPEIEMYQFNVTFRRDQYRPPQPPAPGAPMYEVRLREYKRELAERDRVWKYDR